MEPVSASVFYVKDTRGATIPVLVADDDSGNPRIIPEVLNFARALCAQRRQTPKVIRSWIVALALFHDHIRHVQRNTEIDGGDARLSLAESVSWFLEDRLTGVVSPDEVLCWEPVKAETVERDRVAIRAFSRFCVDNHDHLPIVPEPSATFLPTDADTHKSVLTRLQQPGMQNRILGHLEARKQNPAGHTIGLPSVGRRGAMRQSHLTKAEVERLIRSTKSDVQKMAFILAAFGGARTSEIIQLWVCDIHDGSRRPMFFPSEAPSDLPLVMLADPVHSRHVDAVGTQTETRLQRLAANGLTPRPMLSPTDPSHVGWKGIAYENQDLLISQIHWTDRAWAQIFLDLFRRHRDRTLTQIPSADRTPFALVNDDPRRHEFGRPMKMSNLRKAFLRACEKGGINTGKVGGMHSLRHFYNETLKRLGLAEHEIQVCMHHRSLNSQEAYGNNPAIAGQRLEAALDRIEQKTEGGT